MITDTDRLDFFIENIVQHKPCGYDGLPYGRFDILWESETNDLRQAIDDEINKVSHNVIPSETPMPCPCCGSDDVEYSRNDWGDFVMCNNCGLQACSSDTLPEATPIDVWNKRKHNN